MKAMALPQVGDTINLAEVIARDAVKIVISEGLLLTYSTGETFVVLVAECFEGKNRKPFLRLAGHKDETPADLLRQLADIAAQGEVTIKAHEGVTL